MKDKNQWVQKRLLDINPRAYYTPCDCHNLNLVLGDMDNSCTRVVSFFFLEFCNAFILCLLFWPNSGKSYKKIYLSFQLNHYLKLDGNVELKVSKP